MSKSQAEELRAMKFHTVESIAGASDQQLQRMGMAAGMSPYAFRDKAKAFLNLATTAAETDKREQELNALKEENEKIRAESDKKLSQQQAQINALMSMMTEKKPKTRKPKEIESITE